MSSWYEKHQRRRAAVDAKQKAFAVNQLDMRHLRDASWESRSSGKITKADIKRRIAKRKEQLFRHLQKRRERLAQLLESENRAYNKELENSIETDDQRRARMIEQAKFLQKDREAARRAEVEKIRAEQFKDGLDEFRVLKSKAIKMQCHGGRLAQSQARQKKLLEEQAEDMKIHREYMKISQKMLEREVREAAELQRKNDEMKFLVAQQAAEKRAIRKAEEEEKERDVEEWRQALAEANRAEAEKQTRIHEAKASNVKEMFRLNAINTKRLEAKELLIKQEEAKMLKGALRAERLDAEKEKAHTAERAAEAKRFQAFLQSRLELKEEDESELAQVLEEENERAWAAKEAVWARNRAIKEKLAAEVAGGMAAQVNQHRLDALAIEEEKQRVKVEIAERNRLIDAKEAAKAARKQEEVDAYRASLKTDIALKKVRHQKEAQLLVEERREIAESNQKFDANLKAVMGSSYKPPEHYRKKKVQWYF